LNRTFVGLPGGEDADRQDWSLNVRVQQERQAIAASFCRRVGTLVEDMARDLSSRTRAGRVGFAGGLFASRGLVAALARAFGDGMCIPPVPEPSGRALGAAIGIHPAARPPLHSLALGPQFSESEIKETLENCRLEYLYEPDRHKLATRISRMLARGSVVAWFQGAAGFGPRPVGTRSVLCDPSNRYARENVNRFLRQAPLDDPLPLAMTPTAMRESLDCAAGSKFLGAACAVKPEWRDRLRAALIADGMALVQMTTPDQSEELTDLLSVHRDLTGVPGLIQTSLAGVDEPIACTPRDAVRSMFSSAIDALVIGRFLLMKDHWMLRNGSDS
jgi:carbamoyltransferase